MVNVAEVYVAATLTKMGKKEDFESKQNGEGSLGVIPQNKQKKWEGRNLPIWGIFSPIRSKKTPKNQKKKQQVICDPTTNEFTL